MLSARGLAAVALVAALSAGALARDGVATTEAGKSDSKPAAELALERQCPRPRGPEAGKLEGGPRGLAFSSDSKLIVQGAIDGKVLLAELPDAGDDTVIWHPMNEHLGAVAGVAFLEKAGSRIVASAGDDGDVRVALLAPGSIAVVGSASRTLGMGPLTCLCILDPGPETPRIVVGTGRGSLAFLKLGDQITVERTVERHDGLIASVVALGKAKIASAGWDGAVKITDVASGKELKAAKVSSVELTALATPADAKTLACGSWKKGVQLLDATSLKVLATVEPVKAGATSLLLVGPTLEKARLIAVCIGDETLAVSEPLGSKNELKPSNRNKVKDVPASLAVSPDGSRLATGNYDGNVFIYRMPKLSAGK